MRKAFNFYRSYYDVAKELKESDRAKFLWAILQRQFEGIEPKIDGLAKFAYISQQHSIDSQVIGYEHKTGEKLTPIGGGSVGGSEGGSVQEEGKEQGKVQYVDTSLENCIKLFLEKTAYNWTEQYAKKEAEKFYNFYSAKGWMVGKNKMKSVGHAVNGWIARNDKPETIEPKKDKPIFY
jgi:hypothetical protein